MVFFCLQCPEENSGRTHEVIAIKDVWTGLAKFLSLTMFGDRLNNVLHDGDRGEELSTFKAGSYID